MLRSPRHRDGLPERRKGERRGWQREQRDDLTLSEARHILWERRILVAGCTFLFLAVALLYAFSKEPVYAAEATLSVRSEEGIAPAGSPNEVFSRLRDSTVTDGLSEEAARRAGWESTQTDFNERLYWEPANNEEGKVGVSARGPEASARHDRHERRLWEPANNEEVKVGFSARRPEEAARAANAYAEVFVERVTEF